MNKYVDYLNYRNLQKKSEDIGNILRPLGAPRVQPAEAPVNYRDPVVPQSTSRPIAPQPTPQPIAPQPTPQPVATPYRPPVATRLPARDPLNRNMSEAQRFANGFNGVKSSGLMDKIPAGVMTNDDFADKEMMDYNKGLPSATSPTYAPNVPWEKRPRSTGGYDLVQSSPANNAEWAKGLPNVPVGKPTPTPTPTPTLRPRSTGGYDLVQSSPVNGAEWAKGLPNVPVGKPTPTPTFPVPSATSPMLNRGGIATQTQKPRDIVADRELQAAQGLSNTFNAIKSKARAVYDLGTGKKGLPTPTPTPMPAAPVLPKPLGAKIGQERQSKLNRYIKALELLNS